MTGSRKFMKIAPARSDQCSQRRDPGRNRYPNDNVRYLAQGYEIAGNRQPLRCH